MACFTFLSRSKKKHNVTDPCHFAYLYRNLIHYFELRLTATVLRYLPDMIQSSSVYLFSNAMWVKFFAHIQSNPLHAHLKTGSSLLTIFQSSNFYERWWLRAWLIQETLCKLSTFLSHRQGRWRRLTTFVELVSVVTYKESRKLWPFVFRYFSVELNNG